MRNINQPRPFQAIEKQQRQEEEKRNSRALTAAFREVQDRSICVSCYDTAQPYSHCCYDDWSTPLYAAASKVETRRKTFPDILSHNNHQSRICENHDADKHCHWWRHWTPALCNVPVRARARQPFRLVGPVWRHEMTQAASPMVHKNAGIRKSSEVQLLPVAADSFDAAVDTG